MPLVTLEVDMGKYKSVTVPLEAAEKLIIEVSKRLNVESKDVMEALLRYIAILPNPFL